MDYKLSCKYHYTKIESNYRSRGDMNIYYPSET
jgi:hypothetical protein